MVSELKVVADVWAKVFGEASGAPERIFVTGNHETVLFDQARKKGDFSNPRYADGIYRDVRRNWKAVFGEEWSPFFLKTVKGYSFVGAHWAEWHDQKALEGFLHENRDRLGSGKPFFYVQHAHPSNTCYGDWIWHPNDGNPTQKVLSGYPNAVSFSGHTHYTLTDERSVWQGDFTSMGTGALRWVSLPSGRENGPLGNGEGRRMGNIAWGSQGMVMSVWKDAMVFERYDFVNMEKLGDDWVVPVLLSRDAQRKFSFDARRACAKAPQFPGGAEVKVSERTGKDPQKNDERQLVVSFPAAVGSDSLSRPFEYEVRAEYVESDVVKPMRTKRVYQNGVQFAPARDSKTVECVFGISELPVAKYRFAVTPMNSLGMRGRSLHLYRPASS
jgi:hypothetical protein